MIIGQILKQPIEVLDYDIDCTPLFNGDESDIVESVAVTVTPDTDLVVTSVVNGPSAVKLWVQSGADNDDYTIEVNVSSQAGRTKQDEVMVQVREFV